MLPTGSAGKRYIAEMTRLINAWNDKVESSLSYRYQNSDDHASSPTAESIFQIKGKTTWRVFTTENGFMVRRKF